ncbi:MAG: HAD family phosphatase [Acidobacteria bacterium]|nr:MAG: HAD family phosphatase [Acidobacteriota bacterium]
MARAGYHPPVLRAVLFDFNGVLVDDEPLHLDLFQKVLGEEEIAPPSAAEYYERYLGLDDRACFAAALAATGEEATVPRLMRLIARKASYYQERVRREGYPFSAGAAGLVRDVAARGWMLGVVTGAQREEVEGALRQEGLLDRFKVLITTEDVRESKPNPEGYERALEAFNSLPPLPERLLHPHEVLAVEDSPVGLAAAAEAGLPTLGLARACSRDRLRGADAVVEDLRELTPERLERLYAEASRR